MKFDWLICKIVVVVGNIFSFLLLLFPQYCVWCVLYVLSSVYFVLVIVPIRTALIDWSGEFERARVRARTQLYAKINHNKDTSWHTMYTHICNMHVIAIRKRRERSREGGRRREQIKCDNIDNLIKNIILTYTQNSLNIHSLIHTHTRVVCILHARYDNIFPIVDVHCTMYSVCTLSGRKQRIEWERVNGMKIK